MWSMLCWVMIKSNQRSMTILSTKCHFTFYQISLLFNFLRLEKAHSCQSGVSFFDKKTQHLAVTREYLVAHSNRKQLLYIIYIECIFWCYIDSYTSFVEIRSILAGLPSMRCPCAIVSVFSNNTHNKTATVSSLL